MWRLFGLKNCDKCRKALKLAKEQGIDCSFHDLRDDGLSREKLDSWVGELGWEALLNRQSTTWRGLDEAERAGLNAEKARDLMLRHPTLVKRPVIEFSGGLSVGFDKVAAGRLLSAK